jgi:hypothetical protein
VRARLGPLVGGAFALVLAGCGSGRPDSRLDAAAASALADSLRGALSARYELPVQVRYGKFAAGSTRDSIPGYVVRMSAPYEMVGDDTLPHQWLRARLGGGGWTLETEAEDPDGASYRAASRHASVAIQAAWEDLHDPAEIPDWYSLTLGIPARAPRR